MNPLRWINYFVFVFNLTYTAAFAQSPQWMSVLTTEVRMVRGNEYFELKFLIQDNFHIQATSVTNENLIPTSLSLSLPAGMTIGTPVFPASHAFVLEGSEDTLHVYSRVITVKVPVQRVILTPGKYRCKGSIFYQACTNIKCYFPRTLEFDLPIVLVN